MRFALALAALVAAAPALSLAADQKAPAGKAPAAQPPATGKTVHIKVTEEGYEPREIKVKKGEPTTLVFTRVAERTCMTAVDIPAEGIKKVELPYNKPVAVTVTPKKAGVEAFHCSAMGMGNGKLIVEE
jgi:plastocyanin domain-containing protein